jgi:hypothetical protein
MEVARLDERLFAGEGLQDFGGGKNKPRDDAGWGLLRRFRFGFGRFGEQDFFFKGFAAGVLQGFQCGGAVTSCRVKLGVVRRLVFGISSTLPTGLSAGAPGRIADHAGPCGPILREPVLSPPRSFRQ